MNHFPRTQLRVELSARGPILSCWPISADAWQNRLFSNREDVPACLTPWRSWAQPGRSERSFANCWRSASFPAGKSNSWPPAARPARRSAFAGSDYTVEELEARGVRRRRPGHRQHARRSRPDFVPWAVERGCVVVDESGYWRMDPNVPLVIPEVNPDAVDRHHGHHRQPELLDHAIGRGHEAAARRRPRPPRRRQHLSGHQRRGPGRQPRAGREHARLDRRRGVPAESVCPPDRLQSDSANRLAQSSRATPPKK